jgi:hypothetical protein
MGTAAVLAAAMMMGGCAGIDALGDVAKDLGFEEGKKVDGSKFMMRAGDDLNGMPGVKVTAIKMDAPGRSVDFTIRNDTGSPVEDLSMDVEFGFPAEAGSLADFNPHFEAIEVPEILKAGSEMKFSVPAAGAFDKDPAYVKVHEAGQTSFSTVAREADRSGTRYLTGRVECVGLDANLNADQPTLSFTLENVDVSGAPVGKLEYKVTFKKEGKAVKMPLLMNRFRTVSGELGGKGSTVTVTVKGLEKVSGLSASLPTLRVRAKGK